jgi:hypothetical protein
MNYLTFRGRRGDEDVRALWEPWMVEADRLLEDEELVDLVYQAQGERHEHSATRGRAQTPAETAVAAAVVEACTELEF